MALLVGSVTYHHVVHWAQGSVLPRPVGAEESFRASPQQGLEAPAEQNTKIIMFVGSSGAMIIS